MLTTTAAMAVLQLLRFVSTVMFLSAYLESLVGAQAPDPPTGLSAVHTTSTTIRVYWTPPTAMPTGYEIIYFAGAEDATGTAVSVSGGSTDNSEITDLSATVTYRVSIESVDGATRSITTGPVLAARGPGLALKGKVFPNHSVIRRDPSVIGEDDDALYCVTDDINCCGTPPTSNDENGGSGNGRGYWYFPTPNSMPTKPLDSGTDNTFRWYARWLTGAVLMNFRGLATTGTSNLHYCEIQDSAGTLHQFYTCIFAETGTNIYSCEVEIRDPNPLRFSLQTADPPVFTLTCVSTLGPATNVTWTRDGVVVTGETSQTVVDVYIITYHSTLTVTGSLPGNYTCSVSNDRTAQPATASLTVTDPPNPPLGVTAVFHSYNVMTVSWTPPSRGTIPTKYVIYYDAATSGGADVGNVTVSDASTNITGRVCDAYTVRIMALSDQLPSTVVEVTAENVISPTDVRVGGVGTTTALVSWNTVLEVQKYEVAFERVTEDGCELVHNQTVFSNTTNYTISGLEEYSVYNISIAAVKSSSVKSLPERLQITTLPSAPTGAPERLRSIATTEDTIVIQWGPVTCSERNSRITEYIVKYRPAGTHGSAEAKTQCASSEDGEVYALVGLTVGVQYFIQVAAINDNNQTGPFSTLITGTPVSQHVSSSTFVGVAVGCILSTVAVYTVVLLAGVIFIRWRRWKSSERTTCLGADAIPSRDMKQCPAYASDYGLIPATQSPPSTERHYSNTSTMNITQCSAYTVESDEQKFPLNTTAIKSLPSTEPRSGNTLNMMQCSAYTVESDGIYEVV